MIIWKNIPPDPPAFVSANNGIRRKAADMEIVKGRKSVRTYDGRLLTEESRAQMEEIIASAANPYDIPIEYRFLDPAQYDLKSPVLSGAALYLAAKVKRIPHFEEAFGYSLEYIVLKAWELGIGTVWIGVAGPHRTETETKVYHNDRIRNIERFTAAALDFLRKNIEKDLSI